MNWWMIKAGQLQQMGRSSEGMTPTEYTEEEGRQAAVHTREDLVLVVSLLDTLIGQIIWMKWLLVVITVLCAYLAIR